MVNLPAVASFTNLQKISPVPNSVSRLRGKLEAMRQFRVGASCANTGAATAALPATAPRPACFRKERRCIWVGSSVATRYGISRAIRRRYYTLLKIGSMRGFRGSGMRKFPGPRRGRPRPGPAPLRRVSGARDRHLFDQDGAGALGAAGDGVRPYGHDLAEHVGQIAGNGDFLHRVLDFAVFDPIPEGAPGIVARDVVDALPDELGDQESRAQLAQHGLEIIVGPGQARCKGQVVRAAGVAGGNHAQLA